MAKILVILVVCLVTCYANEVYEYEQAPIEDETELLLDLLSQPIIPERFKSAEFLEAWGIKSRLGAFKWTDCGGAGAKVQNVSLTPDPLNFPGTFTLGFKAMISTSVVAPIKGELLIEKKVGSTYVKIPCIDNFGSCTYDDVCVLLQSVTCPDPFVKAGIDCQCPFKTGNYNVPTASFEVDAVAFPSGDYHVRGSASNGGKVMACLDLYMSVA
ncbi:ganglioside GM2 activator-like [Mizuhopecten yessoensis]|uniref:Ganglioside GM2 activator n=1 Tax=Mizuhopecten yessoensis TaxID=6573 RepID=A0A210Q6B2_MIZYE|nr:ganglioside GM2 activator-like [Mizuhopecten yessoensis]OWF44268.1 Ganglioside GM2 activator [Mizuhopecten yessoensis]